MKFNVLTLALAASALCSFAANAQTTIIEERRAPAVVVEPAPPVSSSVTVKEHGGFLGTTTKTTTETNGTGINGDCSTRTVHKDGIGIDKTVSRTNCQ